MQFWSIVLTTAILLAASPAARGAPPICRITDGVGIANVRIGQAVTAALASTGSPLRQEAGAGETMYILRPPLARMVAANGVVVRVSTESPDCATAAGVRPGAARASLASAYASVMASVVNPVTDGAQITYPFNGIRFVVRADRVAVVEVFTPELFRRTVSVPSPPGPTPQASPAGSAVTSGSWTIAASFAVEGTTMIVTGTADNRGPAVNAFADVAAFDGSGNVVGRGNEPISPSPVPTGGRARFEVRVPITDVVRRYTIDLRPAGAAGVSLARYVAGIVTLAPFGAFIVPHLRVEVRAVRTPPGLWEDLALIVSNNSAYPVASLIVEVELRLVCRVEPLRSGGSRVVAVVLSGRDRVGPVGAGGTGQFALGIAPEARNECPTFAEWTAIATRIVSVELSEERRATRPRIRTGKVIASR